MKDLALFVLLVTVLMSSCSWGNERTGCVGGPRLINPFPDTLTLALRDDPYIFDLEESDKPVFEHSEGGFLNYFASSSDRNIISVLARGQDTTYVFIATTISAGVATVTLRASDDCEGAQSQIFNIEVTQ